MVKFRTAGESDVPAMKKIWAVCFGDSATYIDSFFKNMFSPKQAFLLFSGNNLVSMLFALPMALSQIDKNHIALNYIYAFATDPKFQGRGFGRELLLLSEKELAEKGGQATILVPASERMGVYFARNGYYDKFFIKERCLRLDEIKFQRNDGEIARTDENAYNKLRNELLAGHEFVVCDDILIRYQKVLSEQSGAGIFRLTFAGEQGCAAAENLGDGTVIVKELLVSSDNFYQSIALIAKILPAEKYIVRSPLFGETPAGITGRAFGMMKGEPGINGLESGYLAFAFD